MAESEAFTRFWNSWPGNGSKNFEAYTRKKDRIKCEQKWRQFKLDEQADVILRDVEVRSKYDKAWRQQDGAFLCAPLVYLNNRRWLDGDFADIRDEKRAPDNKAPRPNTWVDDGPPMSRWARGANRIMMRVAYANGRGMQPLGEPVLQRMLRRKAELVADAELMAKDGVPMADQHFIQAMTEALERCLRG